MTKATLYIIYGFIGSGKTTFSKKLSSETGAIHLNPDEYCVRLFDKNDYEQNWEKCFGDTMIVMWEKTAEYLENGTDVILDMGFWDKDSRDFAKSIAEKCNAYLKLFYLYVPDDIAKKRILLCTGKIAENNIKNFDEIKRLFSAPEIDENAVVIDNY